MSTSRPGARFRNFNSAPFVASRSSASRAAGLGVGGSSQAELASQRRLVELAGCIAWQRIDELDEARALETRKVCNAVRMYRRLGQCMSWFHRDDGHADLTPLLVGYADHGGFRNRTDLVQHVFDLGRIDVFAAGNIHVLPPIDDVVEAVFVHPRGVTGVEPAIGKRSLVGVGLFQYPGVTFGPLTQSSPSSPTLASAPSGATMRTSVCSTGLPDEPALRAASSRSSMSTAGLVSVIP